MAIYIIIVIFVTASSLFTDGKKSSHSFSVAYLLTYLAVVCLLGFSRDLGGDKMAYIEDYKYCASFFDNFQTIKIYYELQSLQRYAPLWILFNILCKTISPHSINLLLFIHAIFVNGVIFWFFKKYSTYKFRCLLLYFIANFFILNCETLRETISIALFLLAYPSFIKRKWFKYYLFTASAIGFHYSAIIIAILPVIPTVKIKHSTMLLMFMIACVAYYTINGFLISVSDIMSGSDGAMKSYSTYFSAGGNLNAFIFFQFIYVIFPYIVYALSKHTVARQKILIFNPMINRYFIVAPIIAACISFNRLFSYFSIFSIVIFINIVTHMKKDEIKHILSIIIGCILVIFFSNQYFRPYGYNLYRYDLFCPYTSVFDNIPTKHRETIHNIGISSKHYQRSDN